MTKAQRTRLRKELDRIEKVLLKGDEVAGALFAIMSAQRGPDSHEDDKDYTIKVRRTAFPKLAMTGATDQQYIVRADFNYRWKLSGRRTPPLALKDSDNLGWKNDHFGRHIKRAYRALGIK